MATPIKEQIVERWPYIVEQAFLILPVSSRLRLIHPITGRMLLMHIRLNEVLCISTFGRLRIMPSGVMTFDTKRRFSCIHNKLSTDGFFPDDVYKIINELEAIISLCARIQRIAKV